jgi:hypothetical protein
MEKRVKAIVCLACTGIFMLTTATMSRAVNYLVDPGAEGAVVSGSGNGEGGWSLFNGAAFSTNFAHSGTNSIKEVGPGGFSVPGAFQTMNGVFAGQAWTMTGFGLLAVQPLAATTFGGLQITFFAGPDGTGANLGTVETSPGNALFGNHIDSTSPVGVWIPLSVTAHAPAGAQSVQVFPITIDQTPIQAYYDDMSVIPEPSSIALALTGLFGLVAFGWKKRRV